MITQQELLERFEYRDGELYRKVAPQGTKVGEKVGMLSSNGYVRTKIKCRPALVHRLIFMMHHGYFPEQIDHINGVRSDNRIENLRSVSRPENRYNAKIFSRNKSGVKNVHWLATQKRWAVNITVDKKRKFIGGFTDLEAAELVAQLAREKYHGNFARHI